MQQQDDVRFDEAQISIINRMISEGVDEREAKIRVLCIGAPPEHFKSIRVPFAAYPKMMYHPDGRNQVYHDVNEESVAKENGWTETPSRVNLDKLQTPNTKIVISVCPQCDTDSNGAKFCGNCGLDLSGNFSVPASLTAAAGKQKKASAAK